MYLGSLGAIAKFYVAAHLKVSAGWATICKRTLTLSAILYENRTESITVQRRVFNSGIIMVVGQELALVLQRHFGVS